MMNMIKWSGIHLANILSIRKFLALYISNLFPMFLNSLNFTYAYSVNTNKNISKKWMKYTLAVVHSS